MSSSINPFNVDGTFPIAGQDNSSQGFRDNFTSIQNNFISTKSEIEDLQRNALLISPLSGQTLNNDMAGTVLTRPQLQNWTQAPYVVPSGSLAVFDFDVANFQIFQTLGDGTATAIQFTNCPHVVGTGALGYGIMRVWFDVQSTTDTIVLDDSVSIGVDSITGATVTYDPATGSIVSTVISFDTVGKYLFEFSSVDNGNSYAVSDLTRNRSTLPQIFIGYGPTIKVAKQFEQGQDAASALGSYNSVGVGTLSLANVAYTQMDTGGIGGYSVTGARGSLLSTITPVQPNDILGYHNALAFTGNGAGNVFQQVSSIDFFATGSNVAYGLGGNIAFFTADDGNNGPNKVYQAVSINNDQSTKFFGNVVHAAGFVDQGYQYLGAPSTGFTQTITAGKSRLIIDPAATLSTGTVTLPAGAVDGTIISIHSTAQITALTVNSASGTVKPSAAYQLNAGSGSQFFWHNVESTWYKIG